MKAPLASYKKYKQFHVSPTLHYDIISMIKQIRNWRIIILIQSLHFIWDHIQYLWYKDPDAFNQCTSGQEINTIKNMNRIWQTFLTLLSHLITFLSYFYGKIQNWHWLLLMSSDMFQIHRVIQSLQILGL